MKRQPWPEPNAEQVQRIIYTRGGNAAFHNFHNDYSHILDPNERRRLALSEIDKVPFGWYHFRAVAVAGIGFFTDSYDIFAINSAVAMLGMTFWAHDKGAIPSNVQTAIKAATSGGAVVGQIGFGILADLLGRRRMYGIELTIIIITTLAQSIASPGPATTMTGLLIFWRVIMGIGIGGDYPMSSVITSEFAPTRWRGSMMAAVFSMQGAGQFVAAITALIVTVGFRNSFKSTDATTCDAACRIAADKGWRVIIGFGGLPALFALYYRITIPETPRYTFDVAQDIEKADADIRAFKDGEGEGRPNALRQQKVKIRDGPALMQPKASWGDFVEYFGKRENGRLLFATMASWFFLDLAYYGLGLNNATILLAIGYGPSTTSIYHTLLATAVGNLLLVCAGALPGYWLSILTIDTLGRRPMQISGFAALTLIFCIIGFGYHSLSQGALLALYILAQLFFNFGPNTTTFIVPGECFPTRYRSTCHGLSAAAGKLGAIIAQVMTQFLLRKDAPKNCKGTACNPWLPHLMEIFAAFMFAGTIVSLWIPETKRRTLEDLAGEKPLSNGRAGRNSGSASAGGGSTPKSWLSPMLTPLRSPGTSPALRSKESKISKSGADAKKGGHGKGSGSTDDAIDKDFHLGPGYNVTIESEASMLPGHGLGHGAYGNGGGYEGRYGLGGKREYKYNIRGQRTRLEEIPLQDVGGLIR